jgi:Dyp-type peroxidase family
MQQASQSNAPAPDQVDWSDVQGEIFQPYPHDFAAHLLIHFPDANKGAAFLTSLRPHISSSADWEDQTKPRLNIGLTFNGFVTLGLSVDELLSFPHAFRLGMTARAAILGDSGASDPANWQSPYNDNSVHGWVLVAGATAKERDKAVADMRTTAKASGTHILHIEQAADFTGKGQRTKEHFGFDDGIGQPKVDGALGPSFPGQGTAEPKGAWAGLALGEFLLGYPNELGDAIPFPANPALRLNGTYMAFRKLEQHVVRFRDYIEKNKHLVGGDGELLAAKMVGRWRSGAPLALSPEKDDPLLAADDMRNNDFRYEGDEEGMRVPHLSHIRRANPRDSLPKTSAVQPRLHRIIRRKMPYGPPLPEGGQEDDLSRGIIFRAYNADLVSQFEMIQAQWMASGNQAGALSSDQDVIAGLTDPTETGSSCLGSTFAIPQKDGIKTLYGLPRFVTLRGGAYFFVPGLKALDWIIAQAEAPGGTL